MSTRYGCAVRDTVNTLAIVYGVVFGVSKCISLPIPSTTHKLPVGLLTILSIAFVCYRRNSIRRWQQNYVRDAQTRANAANAANTTTYMSPAPPMATYDTNGQPNSIPSQQPYQQYPSHGYQTGGFSGVGGYSTGGV